MTFSSQLPLPILLPDGETFTSFYHQGNELLFSAILAALQQTDFQSLYFWSAQCAGKSHLLYAACHEMTKQAKQVSYIPLQQYDQLSIELFDGLEQFSLICLDDIDAIAGIPQWELAIFNLFNQVQENNRTALLITAHNSPKQLNILLPDLVSRLNWGQVYQLQPLSDTDKIKALQHKAKLKGFDLPDEVGSFLINHLDRDTRTLFDALNKLDYDSILAQRKLTIPFVKRSLNL